MNYVDGHYFLTTHSFYALCVKKEYKLKSATSVVGGKKIFMTFPLYVQKFN
jgi:hypothetical protein